MVGTDVWYCASYRGIEGLGYLVGWLGIENSEVRWLRSLMGRGREGWRLGFPPVPFWGKFIFFREGGGKGLLEKSCIRPL